LLRIVSLTAFAAGVWYLAGTAAALADEHGVSSAVHAVHEHAPGDAALVAAVSAADVRMLLAEAHATAVHRAGGAVTGDDLAGVPAVRGVGQDLRGRVERLTSGLPRGALPDVPAAAPRIPAVDPPVGGTPDVPVVGRPVPPVRDTASAPGARAPAVTGTTAFPATTRATTVVDSTACPHLRAAVPSGGHSLPRPAVLSAWASDSGPSGGAAGKSPSLCAVAHDAAPPPVLVCTVTAPGGRAPALRLRATEPPVSPD
jgi:hypothetical protein